ncbi:MAG: VWA domain-containing protein [Candidatus Thermoplasmatota archaeon]|nr:VWA domain-containing protein [Candidatus Thermoplasmatota archaeon]
MFNMSSKWSAMAMTTMIVISGLAALGLFTGNTSANPVTPYLPESGDILTGVVNFRCNSTNADKVELSIDGILIATMAGGPTWSFQINTSGWSDGRHIIRYDSTGDTTNDITSIPVKFDNSGPQITNATTLYPTGQNTAKPGDKVTIIAKVIESVSSISSVRCDASMIGDDPGLTMYDDGLHNDGAPNDNTYGTALVNVTVGGGYRAAYVHATDSKGNFRNVTAACNVDQYEPTILEIDTMLPAGQVAVKNGDVIRVTAKALDYKILIEDVVERKPLDVVLVLDNSGSMRDSNGSGGMKWDDLEYASSTFLDQLADNDRCAIVSFDRQGPWPLEDVKQYSTFLTMSETYNDPQGTGYTSTGRNVSKYIITRDDGLHLTTNLGQPSCNTPIWDTIGTGIQYAINNRREEAVPVVIAMTDGNDTGGTLGGNRYETGSETYCPGAPNGAGRQTWTVSGGCIWDSPMRAYPSIQRELDTNPVNAKTTANFPGGSPERTRTGLINASIPVFTIGLGMWPQGTNATASGYLDPTEASYKYTTEFDVMSIANSSIGGKYYFAPSSTDLYAIYNNVSQVIQSFGASTLGIEQPHGIDSIQADLSSIGIALKVNMFDDGLHADGKADDDIYGSDLVTVNSLDSGDIIFQVEGTDRAGNMNGTQYTVRLDNVQPSVGRVNTSYPPGRVKAQDGYSIYVVANCSDEDTGLGNVYLDASNIGGANQVPMRDDGTGNDEVAYDGDYTSDNVTVTTGLVSGVYTHTVNAYDKAGNLGSQSGNIEIFNDVDIIMKNLVAGDIVSGNYQIIANISDPDGIPDTDTNPRYRVDANAWFNMSLVSGTEFGALLDSSLYLDGAHVLHVNAKDPYGAESTMQINFIVDNTAPSQSTVITPISGEYIEGLYSFRVTAMDAIGIQSVNGTIINETGAELVSNTSMGYNMDSGYYELVLGTANLPDGSYRFTAYVHDKAGHSRPSATKDFNVDNNEPRMTIYKPTDGQIIYGTFTLNISVSDAFLDLLEYNIDSSGWVNSSDNWSTWLFPDGDHIMRIRAGDKAGHEVLESIIITIDNHNPECRLNLPSQNQFIEGIYTLGAIVSDEVGLESVRAIILDSGTQAEILNTSMSYNSGTGYFECIFDTNGVNDGNYSTTIMALDLAGNRTISAQVDFQVDNNAPMLLINSPLEGDIVSGSVQLNTSLSGESFPRSLEYNIDSSGWKDVSIAWNTTLIADGKHVIEIRGRDLAGHSTSHSITVTVDNRKPTCEIHTPYDNQYMQGVMTFKVKASDTVGISLVVLDIYNELVNATFNSQSGYYEYSLDTTVILEDGIQTISALAYDLSGKVASDGPVFFNVDNTPPKLVINSPKNQYYLNGSVDMNVTTIDSYPLPTEYNVDSSGWRDIGVPWNTSRTGDGLHSISIRARDAIGHTVVETITVTVDNGFPECTVHSPTPDQFVEGSMTFRILASDSLGVDKVSLYIFTGSPHAKKVQATHNSVSNYYEYTQSLYGITDGGYEVSVTAYDGSLNSVTLAPVGFRVDGNFPTLDIRKPAGNAYLTGLAEIDIGSKDHYDTNIQYNVDKTGWVKINSTGPNLWDTGNYTDGTHEIEVMAVDEAGHVTTRAIKVNVDNSVPELTLVSPGAGDHLTGTNTVKAYCYDTVSVESVAMSVDNSTPISVFINPVTGLYEAPIDTTKYPDGAHTLIITVRDYVGKSNVGMVMVNFNNRGPGVLLDDVPVKGDSQIEFRVENNDNASRMYINIEGAGWKEMGYDEADNSFWYIWTTGVEDNGKHTYQIKAVDEYGNERIQSSVIEVENETPFLQEFSDSMPLILFILLILLIIIIIFVLVRTGQAKKWVKGSKKENVSISEKKESAGKTDDVEKYSEKEEEATVVTSDMLEEEEEEKSLSNESTPSKGRGRTGKNKKSSKRGKGRKGNRGKKGRGRGSGGRYQDAQDDIEEMGGWLDESPEGETDDGADEVESKRRKKDWKDQRKRMKEERGNSEKPYGMAADDVDEMSGWIDEEPDDDFYD